MASTRSWIVAEAVRRYAAAVEHGEPASDLGRLRRVPRHRDLAMTAEERVHEGEETSRRSAEVTAPRTFASFDEFLAWQRAGGRSA